MTTTKIINLFIVLLLSSSVLLVAELFYKKKVSGNVTRKIVHIGAGIVAAFLPVFIDLQTTIIFSIIVFIILFLSKRKKTLCSVHDIERESIGALIYTPSLALTAIIFWPINQIIFQGSALILGLSDGVSGIIGKSYGKRKNIFGNKTMEGSLSFFLMTVLILSMILFIYSNQSFFYKAIFIVVGSLILTITEALFNKGWDNLFIPIVAGIILFFALS
jgi:phytol kinase